MQQPDPNLPAERMAELHDYERHAAELSPTLFHDAGMHDLDPWRADFFRCNQGCLAHLSGPARSAPSAVSGGSAGRC